MKPDEIKEWLEPEEIKDLNGLVGYASVHSAMDVNDIIKPYESLATCRKRGEQRRKLMEKHQWVRRDRITMYCLECEATYDLLTKRTSWTALGQPTVEWDGKRHGLDCLWAQAIHTDLKEEGE